MHQKQLRKNLSTQQKTKNNNNSNSSKVSKRSKKVTGEKTYNPATAKIGGKKRSSYKAKLQKHRAAVKNKQKLKN